MCMLNILTCRLMSRVITYIVPLLAHCFEKVWGIFRLQRFFNIKWSICTMDQPVDCIVSVDYTAKATGRTVLSCH